MCNMSFAPWWKNRVLQVLGAFYIARWLLLIYFMGKHLLFLERQNLTNGDSRCGLNPRRIDFFFIIINLLIKISGFKALSLFTDFLTGVLQPHHFWCSGSFCLSCWFKVVQIPEWFHNLLIKNCSDATLITCWEEDGHIQVQSHREICQLTNLIVPAVSSLHSEKLLGVHVMKDLT